MNQILRGNSFHWKWYSIALAMFALFHFLPIFATVLLTQFALSHTASLVLASWVFGGATLISGVVGYLSPTRTLREPILASITLVILWIVVFSFISPAGGFIIQRDAIPTITILSLLVAFSFAGAWIGEHLQQRKIPDNG